MRRVWSVFSLILFPTVAHPENVKAPEIATPRVLHEELQLELYCSEPRIATPVALDIDTRGRVWVIESNTHFQQPNYERHPSDRVLILQGTREDGRVERLTTFTDGLTHAMGLACRDPGMLLLATRRDIMLLEDTDANDHADRKTYLARLETKEVYPHDGLTGFAIDELGLVYFAIGENLAAPYRLVGADGRSFEGGPDGGSIFRMRADGTDLERWAAGFWNTFHLAFDRYGRLFAVDNDPDSSPPCRLLRIIRGGDYGYRRWLGRKGLHPFTSWDGQIPGTLPMVAGTGEAPSGVLAYEHHRLPEDFRGRLLVTSWGDHRIESYTLKRHGASFVSSLRPMIVGGESFRPVGIAMAPDGSVYFSDWVDKDYNVHGKGRIWKLGSKAPSAVSAEAPTKSSTEPDESRRILFDSWLSSPIRGVRDRAAQDLAEETTGGEIALKLIETGSSTLCRYHALVVLARRGELGGVALDLALKDEAPEVRAAAIRLLRELDPTASAAAVVRLLADPDPAVKLEAMLALVGPLPMDRHVEEATPPVSLEPAQSKAVIGYLKEELRQKDPFRFSAAVAVLGRLVDTKTLLQLTNDAPAEERLGYLLAARGRGNGDDKARAILTRSLKSPDPTLRRAALEWIGMEKLNFYKPNVDAVLTSGPVTRELFEAYLATKSLLANVSPEMQDGMEHDIFLSKIILDTQKPAILRAFALRCLSPTHPSLSLDVLEQLIRDPANASSGLGLEALRSLRESPLPGSADLVGRVAQDAQLPVPLRREAIVGMARALPETEADLQAFAEQGDAVLAAEAKRALRLHRVAPGHDEEDSADPEELDVPSLPGGRPAEGQILFNYPTGTKCSSCHRVNGRGGDAGPDLSTAGRMAPEKLVQSILSPSREISPQFATWVIHTPSGVKTGIIAGEDADGTLHLVQADGTVELIAAGEVISRETTPSSIMPDDLTAALTPEEVRDLMAYLMSLK